MIHHRMYRRRGVSSLIAEILTIAVVAVLASIVYLVVTGYISSPGAKRPAYIGLLKTTPQIAGCNGGSVYYESVDVTSTSGVVSTGTLGLKILPSAGGSPPVISSNKTWQVGFTSVACPQSGWWAVLNSAGGNALACFSSNGLGFWAPVSATGCGNRTVSPPVVLGGGDLIVFYDVGIGGMGGFYTVQAYGLGGAAMAGSTDL